MRDGGRRLGLGGGFAGASGLALGGGVSRRGDGLDQGRVGGVRRGADRLDDAAGLDDRQDRVELARRWSRASGELEGGVPLTSCSSCSVAASSRLVRAGVAGRSLS